MALVDPVEITHQLSDLNHNDRVFRTASGYVVKVKHVPHVRNADMVAFRLTGSLCNAAGKAFEAPAGFHAEGSELRHWILDGEYARIAVRMFHALDVHPGPAAHEPGARPRTIEQTLQEARVEIARSVELAALAHAEGEALEALEPSTPAPPLPPLNPSEEP